MKASAALSFPVIALMGSPVALASDFTTEQDLLIAIPTVSGVTHLEQKLVDAPASVTILDRRTIEASTATSVTDLFRLVPGFQSYWVNGSRPGVNYHALADEYPRRLEVKIDGRSVYESMLGAVVWPSLGIELDDIERIEVVRGPNAPADGSNAFTGSINIITRSPFAYAGWRLSTVVGSDHWRAGAISYSGDAANVGYRIKLGYRHNDGFDDAFEEVNTDSTDVIDYSFRALWTPTAFDNIELQLGGSDGDLGVGDDGTFSQSEYQYQYQYLNWQRITASGGKLQLLLYHNELQLADREPRRLLSELLTEALEFPVSNDDIPYLTGGLLDKSLLISIDDGRSERWDMELRASSDWSHGLRMVFGIASRLDKVKSQFVFDRSDEISEQYYRGYSNLEWHPVEQWVFNAGVIAEYNSHSGNVYSYRLSTNYLLGPDYGFRLAINRGERTVSLLEREQSQGLRYSKDLLLDAVVQASPQQDAEKIDSAEFGFSGSYLAGALSLDAKLFYEELDDIMNIRRDYFPEPLSSRPSVGVRDNVVAVDIKGVELQWSYRPDQQWLIQGNYAYLSIDGVRHRATYPNPEFEQLNQSAPAHSGALLVGYQSSDGWMASIGAFYLGGSKFFQGDYTDSYTRVDAKLAREWQTGDRVVRVSLTAQNLGGKYQEFFETNLFDTAYMVDFKVLLP